MNLQIVIAVITVVALLICFTGANSSNGKNSSLHTQIEGFKRTILPFTHEDNVRNQYGRRTNHRLIPIMHTPNVVKTTHRCDDFGFTNSPKFNLRGNINHKKQNPGHHLKGIPETEGISGHPAYYEVGTKMYMGQRMQLPCGELNPQSGEWYVQQMYSRK